MITKQGDSNKIIANDTRETACANLQHYLNTNVAINSVSIEQMTDYGEV